VLRKHGVPAALGYFSFDSWLQGKREAFRLQHLEEAKKAGMLQEEAATAQATKQADHTTNILKNKLEVVTNDLNTATTEVNTYSEKISKISSQLADPSSTPRQAAEFRPHLAYYQRMYREAEKQQALSIKEVKNLSDTTDPTIIRSDFSELFHQLADSFKDYLSILSSEQMVILFNLFGYMLLIMVLTSITILLIGDDLIRYFQLESKYPKLAKYIKFQLTVRKYQLKFLIVYFYFLILGLVSVNIFMFSYDCLYI
jgi:hypothetical protein